MKEKWKDVPDYEDFYKASNTGKVFSKRQNREITGYLDNGGYRGLTLYNETSKWKQRRSRIIYRTFRGQLTEFDLIHHKDENKINDRITNLVKTTRPKHKKIHPHIGERTRFKQKYVFDKKEIKKMYKTMSADKIGGIKGCSGRTILRIINS